jgi:hypothetical protein
MTLIYEVAVQNLLSPMVLFFLLGIVAVIVNSDLKVPEAFYSGYTMIILLTIGIKGGTEMRHVSFADMLPAALTAIALSLIMLLIAFAALRYVYRYSLADSVAVAAHYGSVSAVTFIACITFLEKQAAELEPYTTALLVLMEAPAIIAAIVLYKWLSNKDGRTRLGHVLKESLFGKSIFLLLGGIFVGLTASEEGLLQVKPLFGDLFYGILCIFLLHLGMVSFAKLRQFKGLSVIRLSFVVFFPLIGGAIGLLAANMLGLSVGGMTVLATLSASASYIAAPAAMEHSIKEANSGLYVGTSLGLTLPFNLIIGIPLYYTAAQWLSGL